MGGAPAVFRDAKVLGDLAVEPPEGAAPREDGRGVTRANRVLSRPEKARLRHIVEEAERETGAEIAVLVLPHVEDVERFAAAYINHLGVGKRGHDNGILILVAVDRRVVRIEVGRGLDAAVPPDAARHIIEQVMAPAFRERRYGEGLERAVEALTRLIRRR